MLYEALVHRFQNNVLAAVKYTYDWSQSVFFGVFFKVFFPVYLRMI